MKRALIALALGVAVFLSGCCDEGSEPPPPYGNPDDISRYSGTNGYESVDFIYYCLSGEYVSFTYIRPDECSEYELDSIYRSGGICD